MDYFDSSAVKNALPYPQLIEALTQGLQLPIEVPPRSYFAPNADASCVLIMPAWKAQEVFGVKLVSVWPSNKAIGSPTVSAVYVLLSCENGMPLAVIDGTELTLRRTAAAAALAAKILARKNSQTLAILGTGALCVPMVQAHASVHPFKNILIWGRQKTKALEAVAELTTLGIESNYSEDLKETLNQADVVAAATTATEPFILSKWLKPGTHLGLIGAFTPQMAEAEPALMNKVQVYADNRAAVLEKGGEIYQAIQQGILLPEGIEGELAELASDPSKSWRKNDQSITVFKSVGFASLDLIAAELVYQAGSHKTVK
jgi:ornithine cyclodeaminase/alanine dehydrogenase-like protein (mu-crystallin family)